MSQLTLLCTLQVRLDACQVMSSVKRQGVTALLLACAPFKEAWEVHEQV